MKCGLDICPVDLVSLDVHMCTGARVHRSRHGSYDCIVYIEVVHQTQPPFFRRAPFSFGGGRQQITQLFEMPAAPPLSASAAARALSGSSSPPKPTPTLHKPRAPTSLLTHRGATDAIATVPLTLKAEATQLSNARSVSSITPAPVKVSGRGHRPWPIFYEPQNQVTPPVVFSCRISTQRRPSQLGTKPSIV